MSDDKIIPFPDTFKPLGVAAKRLLESLDHNRAHEFIARSEEKTAEALNSFAENQKGKSK